jgi:phage terminase large subunit GpA-like protein
MLCAEFINERGEWDCPTGKANHAWDLGVYYLALVDWLDVKYWPNPAETAPPPAKTPKTSAAAPQSARW